MLKINAKKIAEIVCSASNVVDVDIENISTDSRNIIKGDMFVALKGEKFDGHDFVADVINKGAAVVLVDHLIKEAPAVRQIVVSNTLEAFGKIGAYVRSFYKGTVIALTGSAGKTTTKEELKFLLSKFAPVYATPSNYNNFIGVAKTLCDMDMNAKYAIVEMGMSSKGEIAKMVDWVKPDMAIVTNVYQMHREFFPSFEAIAEAKAEIFTGLKKGGTAFINEDTNFADLLEKRALENGAKIVKFGKKNHPNVHFETANIGEHYLYNAWCTLSVVQELGLDVEKAASYIKDFGALDGRGKLWKLKFSKGSYTLIDDSYSGQPEAMQLALQALANMKTPGRKIAVLGKMAELGVVTKEKHINIGQVAAHSGLNVVIGVCPEMKDMLAQIPASVEKYYFEDKNGLDDFLLNKCLQNNDTVLIKGARYSSKLYQVTDSLIKQGRS